MLERLLSNLLLSQDRNQESTVWVGGLEPPVTEELLYELMLQAGPVVQLNMPRDPVTQLHQVRTWQSACIAKSAAIAHVHTAMHSALIVRIPFKIFLCTSRAMRLSNTAPRSTPSTRSR